MIRKFLCRRNIPTYIYYFSRRTTKERLRRDASTDLEDSLSSNEAEKCDDEVSKPKKIRLDCDAADLPTIFDGLLFCFVDLAEDVAKRLGRFVIAYDGQWTSDKNAAGITHFVVENESDEVQIFVAVCFKRYKLSFKRFLDQGNVKWKKIHCCQSWLARKMFKTEKTVTSAWVVLVSLFIFFIVFTFLTPVMQIFIKKLKRTIYNWNNFQILDVSWNETIYTKIWFELFSLENEKLIFQNNLFVKTNVIHVY